MAAKNNKQIACYVRPQQHAALKALCERTHLSMQDHLREAVDDLLVKYKQSATRSLKGKK